MTTRSGRIVHQLASESEESEDEEQAISRKHPGKSQPPVSKQKIRSDDKSADTMANAVARKTEMEERLKTPLESKNFIPNDADIEWEKLHILRPCFMDKNKKFSISQGNMKSESRKQLSRGELPSDPADARWISSTYKVYRTGARQLMGLFKELLGRDVHYSDFFAFGTHQLIRPVNLIDQITDKIDVGNYQKFVYAAYLLVLQAQSEEADRNPLAFKSLIENPNSLSSVQLENRCEKEAGEFRNRIMTIRADMKDRNPYGSYTRAQKAKTSSRKENMETLEGIDLPDPSLVLPAYFTDPRVHEIEKKLLDCAQTAHEICPTKHQIVEFTNFMLVRMLIKNANRKEIIGNMTRAEYLKGREDPIKEFPYEVHQKGSSHKDVVNLDGFGKFCISNKDADEDRYPEEQQGIIIRTFAHKNADKGAATTFLSLVDTILMDAYYTITRNFILGKGEDFHHHVPLFINGEGKQFLTNNREVDFSLFQLICEIPSFHPHVARHMFVGFMCNQGSVALAEYAAFTACHSQDIQQSTYLGDKHKRLKQLFGSTFFNRHAVGEQGRSLPPGERYSISADADKGFATDMKKVNRERWDDYLKAREEADKKQEPTERQVVTPHVTVKLFDLIWTVGLQGELDKRLNLGHQGLLKKLLSGKPVKNNDCRSLIMTMMDFAPELESSKVLLENLYWFCQLQAGKEDVNTDRIEYDWTEKLVQIIDNYHDKGKNMKNECMKDLFAHPNLENNYKFCFGNQLIKQTLQQYNIFLEKRNERIDRMTQSSGAISVSEGIKKLNEDTSKKKEKRQFELDSAAVSRQSNSSAQSDIPLGESHSQVGSNPPALRPIRSARKQKQISSSEESEMESQHSGQKRKHDDEDDEFFDDPADADYEENSFPVQKLAKVQGTPGKTIQLRTASGAHLSFAANDDTTIFEVASPQHVKRKRNWTDDDKLELAKLYIENATVVAPFNPQRGKENPVKADMRAIRSNKSIGGKSLKERVKNADTLADFMTRKGFSGQANGKGLKHIIEDCLEEEYPDTHNTDWTPRMMRDIREKILERMKTFMKE